MSFNQCPDCGYQEGDSFAAQGEREELELLRQKYKALEAENIKLKNEVSVVRENNMGILATKTTWETVLANIKNKISLDGLEALAQQNIRVLAELLTRRKV